MIGHGGKVGIRHEHRQIVIRRNRYAVGSKAMADGWQEPAPRDVGSL